MDARLTSGWLLGGVLLLAAGVRLPAADRPAAAATAAGLETPPAQASAVNTRMAQALAALLDRRWPDAETLLKQLIAASPDAPPWELYQALGRAQVGLRKYADAVRTYDQGIALAKQRPDSTGEPAPVRAGLEQMLTAQGNAYLMLKQTDQAIARFNEAASISPNPGTALFNISATLYNLGDMDGAAKAADRAIAADPKKADAWFIKGSALYGSGHLEGSRYVVPPATVAALRKYLELVPEGGHAIDVKAMLDALTEQPATSGTATAK